jgi:hypothetical protein
MKKTIAAIVFFISTITNAQLIYVEGNPNCGSWLEARTAKMASNLESFVLGYVNGLAVGRSIDIWRFKKSSVSREQLYFWMDEYCRKNSLKGILDGSMDFTSEMTNGEFFKEQKK